VLTRDLDPGGQPGPTGAGRKMMTSVVIQNVRVLGMDLNANPTSTQPAVASTATLEVTMTDAEKLALASQDGTLSLALRRPGAVDITPIRPMLVNDLGPVGGAAVHHDAGPARHPKAASHSDALPRIDTGVSVTVVNGDTASSLKVPFESASAGL
jgi:pilus assembly protein CpaB